MSDYGDSFRESRNRRQEHRAKYAEYCVGCMEKKTYPGDTCSRCGTVDTREIKKVKR